MSGQLSAHIDAFVNFLRFEKRYSQHTVIAYTTDLQEFTSFLSAIYGDIRLEEISYTFIRSWLAHLMEQEISPRSINRKISTLKSFFKYQIKTGAVAENPMFKIVAPKAGKRLPSFVNEEDMKTLTQALETATEDWKSLNAKMLIELFYGTGMRLSELLQLKETQVDLSRKQVKVLGKGNKERVLPLDTRLMASVREYLQLRRKHFTELPEELLVTEKGRKLYPKYAYLLVKKYLSAIATLDKKSPHVLRHTFATHLMNNGAEIKAVKELLGHASLAATQVYTHNSIEKLKEVYRNAHPKAR
ncbi:tyrosine-type recombinase/integrase [Niabella beijingensis]|uniref:tyrosine-type recombinase/integrase n=1 Tax=Niabella beijingensis TaxID=2872700 RepID=UPI001CBCC583|nr:tyrosine-type recombinase/integrase [Niabella beijingensis]MBZ4192098.1 tyrosine-type recombinase/integrase [Niabella beijingensis]